MITEIGIVAGDVWHYLDTKGQITLSGLVAKTGKGRDLVLMSVGWLAREGHVVLKAEGQDYNISLRK